MKAFFITILFSVLLTTQLMAQAKGDISVSELPENVKAVLVRYVQILRENPDLDDAAKAMVEVAGGGLVNEDGKSLRSSVQPYSLKKDHSSVKFYADPVKITRVNMRENQSSGFGESAIRGTLYKIWIAKADGQAGMPAPISILVPEGHEWIKDPKVIGIGSL